MKKLKLCLCLLASLTVPARSMPMAIDVVDVPIEQLIARYRGLVKKTPGDFHLHYVLGRVDALAYFTTKKTITVDRKTNEPFDQGVLPPLSAHRAPDAYLNEAVSEYGKAVKLKPDDTPSRQGWAWCLDQAGQKSEARAQYRRLFAEAYKREAAYQSIGVGPCFTRETGNYLLPLLNPSKDKAEIADIQAKMLKSEKFRRAITPIVVPVDRQAELSAIADPAASVSFDLDGTGKRQWNWITPKGAWLVYLDRRPTVESGLQMVGSVTFWIFWQNGYQALVSLDRNGDGWLRGSELNHLGLWRDANRNGICEPGEVLPLASYGIVALSTSYSAHPAGCPYSPQGVVYGDGTRGPSYDWMPKSAR